MIPIARLNDSIGGASVIRKVGAVVSDMRGESETLRGALVNLGRVMPKSHVSSGRM